MIWNLPCGYWSRICLSIVVSMMYIHNLQAQPNAIDDEAFLLFLADSQEQDGEWLDPLSMATDDEQAAQPAADKPADNSEEAKDER